MTANDMARRPAAPPATDFNRRVYCLLGLPFDALTLDQAQHALRAALLARRRCFFSTPNLNFLIASHADAPFRDSVIRSDLSFADGMPIVWIARALGLPVRARVAGSTVFELLRRDPATPVRVYFFGGPDGVARRAGEVLNAEGGSMVCVGAHSPGFGTLHDMSGDAVLDAINAAEADLLVVALGAKRGQAWIEHNLPRLRTPLVSHLGAVVNFVAGTVERAPSRVGALGLEWLWRIKEEPALWRRYWQDGMALLRLTLTRIVPGALAAAAARRRRHRLPPATVQQRRHGAGCRLTLGGGWHEERLAPLRAALFEATAEAGAIDVVLAEDAVLDHAALGLLTLLYGHQSKRGDGWRLSAPPALQRYLRRQGADYLLQALDAPATRPAPAPPLGTPT